MGFASYKKKSEFVFAEKKLKEHAIYKTVFITEDLTSLQTEWLRYVKEECEDNFVLYHTINDVMRMKKSAYKNGIPLDKNGKDQGTDNWLYINSTDDLFRYDVNIDFSKLNCKPLSYNDTIVSDADSDF